MAPAITVHNTTAQTKKSHQTLSINSFPTHNTIANDHKLEAKKKLDSQSKRGRSSQSFLFRLHHIAKEQHKEIRDSCVRRDCCERLLLHVVSLPHQANRVNPLESGESWPTIQIASAFHAEVMININVWLLMSSAREGRLCSPPSFVGLY